MATPPLSVRALNKMREGLLYVLVGWLLLGLSLMIMFISVFIAFGMWFDMQVEPHHIDRHFTWLPTLLWVFIPALACAVAGGTLTLVGLYKNFIPGTAELAVNNPNFSTPSTLIKLGYLWGIILILAGSALIPTTYGVSLTISALGIILLILGHIGMTALCLKLNDIEKNTLYLISGILFIVSILAPIIAVISLILLYIALGDSVRKYSEQKALTT